MLPVHLSFSGRLITFNFCPIPIVFHQFFTWIVLGDVDLHFSFMLIREASAVEEDNK